MTKQNKMWALEKYPPNPNNWQKQKCDTPAAWILFQKFLQLDEPRYLKNIPGIKIRPTGKVSSHIEKWCAGKAWKSRAEARDNHLLKEKAKRIEKSRERLIEDQEEVEIASRKILLKHVENLSMTLVGYATDQIWVPPVFVKDIQLTEGKFRKLKGNEKIDPWRYKAILSIMAICGISAKTQIEITDGTATAERPDISKFEGMTIDELTKLIFEERK